jgi:hypothetical protein
MTGGEAVILRESVPFVILRESFSYVILRESAGRPKDLAVFEILRHFVPQNDREEEILRMTEREKSSE